MAENRRTVSMGFTSETYPEGTHMCLIYDDEAQRRRIIPQFLQSGLVAGERVVYLADIIRPDQVQDWLKGLGVEMPGAEQTLHFEAHSAQETYCSNGQFVPDSMLDRLRASYREAVACGCTGARVSGEMSWALRDIPGSDRLMEYEARVNDVVSRHPVTAVCQYDARRFDGATILNVHRVHPMVIVGEQVFRNPYYVKPEEFLTNRSPT